MQIIGLAPYGVAQGIEQLLIELNSNGLPLPKGSFKIDNLRNSIDPAGLVDYIAFKFLGEIWLNHFYPDWRDRGDAQSRSGFLRKTKR